MTAEELSISAAIRMSEKPDISDVRAIREARIADLVGEENWPSAETEEVGSVIIRVDSRSGLPECCAIFVICIIIAAIVAFLLVSYFKLL